MKPYLRYEKIVSKDVKNMFSKLSFDLSAVSVGLRWSSQSCEGFFFENFVRVGVVLQILHVCFLLEVVHGLAV